MIWKQTDAFSVRKGRVLLMLLLSLFLMQYPVCARARDTYDLNVDYSVENHTRGIAGGLFEVIKVLDCQNDLFTWAPAIRHQEVNMDEVLQCKETAAQELVRQNENAAMREGISNRKAATDAQGKICFQNLSAGVWLLRQSGAQDAAKGYEWAKPCLVVMNAQSGAAGAVTVYPKTEKCQETETLAQTEKTKHVENQAETTRENAVKTGDTTPIGKHAGMMAGAGLVIGICENQRRKQKKKYQRQEGDRLHEK